MINIRNSLRAASKFIAIAITGLALVACAPPTAPQSSAPSTGGGDTALRTFTAPALGAAGYQSMSVGGVSVPLPEGRWTLIGSKDLTKNDNYPANGYILVSETNGAIDRIVTLWRMRTFSGRFGDFKNCSAKSNLASDVVSQKARSTDCVYVRAVPWPDKGRMGGLLRGYAKANGLYAPLVTVGPRIALSLTGQDRIAIDYGFNADMIAPHPTGGFWRPEDWTPATTTSGARGAFVDAMRSFGATMRPEVARANGGGA